MNTPSPHQFDLRNARALCLASAEAYNSDAAPPESSLRCEAADTHVCIQRRASFSEDDDGGEMIIAFRGTADLRNALTDMDCKLIRAVGYRIHRGFHEAVEAIDESLAAALGDEQGMRLWVTGHSLGGALAELWALRALERGHEIAGVYTFGQPRVGDAAFAAYYDSLLRPRTFRVVHGDDVVPRIPWLLAKYRHAGNEIFFPRASSAAWIENCPWWRKLMFDVLAVTGDLGAGRIGALDSHHISNYLALFSETAPSQTPNPYDPNSHDLLGHFQR